MLSATVIRIRHARKQRLPLLRSWVLRSSLAGKRMSGSASLKVLAARTFTNLLALSDQSYSRPSCRSCSNKELSTGILAQA